MAIIGIDLGTTNSLVCTYKDGKTQLIPNNLGQYITKSAVSLMEDGSIVMGATAKERLVSYPQNTAVSFKAFMGTEREFLLSDQSFQAQELSAFVLKQLKSDAERYLKESVDEAVISVPAYFNDNQRCATKLAARLAGLQVSRLINEPSAAALYYYTQTKKDCNLLVIDFGGGTFDVSVVECFEDIIEIIAIAGDNHLGGDDINHALVDYFCHKYDLSLSLLPSQVQASLYRQAEAAKIGYTQAQMVMCCRLNDKEYCLVVTETLLREVCQPLFSRMKKVIAKALQNSRMGANQLTDVILVGGSSKLPIYIDYLLKLFGKSPFLVENPDEIVALGTGLCSALRSRELKDVVMTDVCPFSLGIATYHSRADREPHMAVIIERSSLLPASHKDRFYTLTDFQQQVRLMIFQGENYRAYENLKLGEVNIQVPPGVAGKHYVDVVFTYDIDGILHVEASGSGGDIARKVILNPKLTLSDEELAEKLEKLAQVKLSTEGSAEDRLLQARLERLYYELAGEARIYAATLLGRLEMVRRSGDLTAQKRLRYDLQKDIRYLEQELITDFSAVQLAFLSEEKSH